MAQRAKCLPCKHGDLSLIPRTHVKKPGGGGLRGVPSMVGCMLIISALGMLKQVDPWGFWPAIPVSIYKVDGN